MKLITVAIPVGMAFALSGCAVPRVAKQLDTMEARLLVQEKSIKDYKERLADQKDRLAAQEKRLGEQERQNELLKKELAATRKNLEMAVAGKVNEAMKEPRLQAEIQKLVEQNVARRIEEIRRRGGEGGREDRARRREEWRARREEREKQELQKFATGLKLDKDQQTRLNEHAANIREEISTAIQQMREQGNFNLEEIKASVEDLKHRNDAVMKDLLTVEQYAEYEKRPNPLDRLYEFFTGRAGRGGRRGGGERGER